MIFKLSQKTKEKLWHNTNVIGTIHSLNANNHLGIYDQDYKRDLRYQKFAHKWLLKQYLLKKKEEK